MSCIVSGDLQLKKSMPKCYIIVNSIFYCVYCILIFIYEIIRNLLVLNLTYVHIQPSIPNPSFIASAWCWNTIQAELGDAYMARLVNWASSLIRWFFFLLIDCFLKLFVLTLVYIIHISLNRILFYLNNLF